MHWNYPGGMGWMMALAWVSWILLIGGLAWLAFGRIAHMTGSGDSPEGILKRRYARGDIDREEYQRCLSDLRR